MTPWSLFRGLGTGAMVSSLSMLAIGCDESAVWHRMDLSDERMLDQRRGDPFSSSPAFADGRAMRTPPLGTMAREDDAPPLKDDGGFVDRVPYPVTRALLERGRSEFEITCAPCHGILGDADSVVASKMELRPPPSLHLERIRALPLGEVASVIEQGYGLMPAYAAVLAGPRDVWAVVAYVRALELSQHAVVASLPDSVQGELSREAP